MYALGARGCTILQHTSILICISLTYALLSKVVQHHYLRVWKYVFANICTNNHTHMKKACEMLPLQKKEKGSG